MNDLLLEALEAESDIDHFVSIKGFKHKKMFKPKITASSPCLPKLHMAYEGITQHYPISEEEDDNSSGELPSEKAKRLRGRICERKINSDFTDVEIIDEEGTSIMYDASLHDIVSLEEEMIKIGTYYIRKQEFMIDVEMKEAVPAIDRGALCGQLLEYEHKFQYAKIKVIEIFMEAYDHTCDLLEQQRLVQIISDFMAKRPRLNTDATHFIDSYKSEIKYLTNLHDFIKEIIRDQKKKELNVSNDIKDYLELKYRKVNEHANKKWEYKKADKKDQDAAMDQSVEYNIEDGDDDLEREEKEKKKRLANIAKRHITDFTKNYDQDFTEVLGLPEITADDLFKKNREKEPIVIDALRQQARFIKIEEGYPHFFHTDEVLNFYDGLA